MKKGDQVIITEAEDHRGLALVSPHYHLANTRTVYAMNDDGWYDTQGAFWPMTDNDQYRYTLVNEYAREETNHHLPGDTHA